MEILTNHIIIFDQLIISAKYLIDFTRPLDGRINHVPVVIKVWWEEIFNLFYLLCLNFLSNIGKYEVPMQSVED